MIEVPLTTTTFVAEVPPNLTVAPVRKPVPLIFTAVPPLTVPALGVIEVTVGAGAAPNFVNFATEGTPLLFSRKSM